MTYEVRLERDETGWWVASVPAVPACHTQGRTIEEARRRIRKALGLFADDADTAELVDSIRLPAPARRALERHRRVRQRLEQAEAESKVAAADAARVLAEDVGLSVRDVGKLLQLSHQRVQQIRADQRKPTRGKQSRRAHR